MYGIPSFKHVQMRVQRLVHIVSGICGPSLELLCIGIRSVANDRPTGEPFPEGSWRAEKAETQFTFFGALLHLKRDWAEFSHTLGFADWSSALYCCLFCKATKENRFNVAGFSPLGAPWGDLYHADMERACDACEMWRTLSREQHVLVRAALVYEKKGRRRRQMSINGFA